MCNNDKRHRVTVYTNGDSSGIDLYLKEPQIENADLIHGRAKEFYNIEIVESAKQYESLISLISMALRNLTISEGGVLTSSTTLIDYAEFQTLPPSLVFKQKAAIKSAKDYRAQYGNPIENLQSILSEVTGDLDLDAWQDIVDEPYG